LVPDGHGGSKSTEVIEIDGISSKPLSKEAAKDLQNQAQQNQEAKQYQWNDANRMNIAKEIGKKALVGAAMTAATTCDINALSLASSKYNRLLFCCFKVSFKASVSAYNSIRS